MECEPTLELLGEKRGKAEQPRPPCRPDLLRIVALYPAVEPAVADLVADQAHSPDAGLHAHDAIGAEIGREVDRDVVAAVGG